MILLSRFADAQLDSLTTYYEVKDRPEAARNLRAAVVRTGSASQTIGGHSSTRWLKERSYWIAFADNGPDIEVTAIFHESANIPARLP